MHDPWRGSLVDPTFSPVAALAAALLQKLDTTPAVLGELHQLVRRLHFTQPAQALALAERIFAHCAEIPPPDSIQIGWILGDALFYNGQYVPAQHHLTRAYHAYLSAGAVEVAARVGVAYVGVLVHVGQVEAALRLAEQIEPTLAQSARRYKPDLHELARLSMAIGLAYELTGDGERSLAIYDQQMPLALGLGDAALLARLNCCRARALTQLSAFAEALAAFSQAEFLLHSVEAPSELLRLYLDRTSLLIALGRYREAAAAQTLIQQNLPTDTHSAQAQHRLTLLQVQLALATHVSVPLALIDALKAAQQAFAQAGPFMDECLAWLLLGRCALINYDLDEAHHCYTTVLAFSRTSGEQSLELRALHGLAIVEQRYGRSAEALLLLQLAIDKLEIIRQRLQIEIFRVAFLSDHLALYHDLIELYRQQNHWEETFLAVERAKARLVSEQWQARQQWAVTDAIHAADEHTRRLAQRLQTTLGQLDQLYRTVRTRQISNPNQPATNDEEMGALTTLEHLAHTLTLQIQQQQSLYSGVTSTPTSSLLDLQAAVGAATLIQYYALRDRYYAFVLNEDGICAHCELTPTQPVTYLAKALAASIERAVSLARQLGPERLVQRVPALVGEVNKQLQGLWQLLVQPLTTYLPPKAPLIIAPDGALHLLPFHAFYNGAAYWLEQHTISYVPSATVLAQCSQQPGRGAGVFLCGYDDGDLPAVPRELQMLQRLFPQAIVAEGATATTAAFHQHAPARQLVHLAAHAAFHRERPLLSALILADRRLTLAEVTRLNFSATLVTLSGCETGYGKNQGTDLVSLASGFLGAGAQALLVSLWSVADAATEQLMTAFYQHARRGTPLNEALAHAQRTLLAQGRSATALPAFYQHPAFWSPFILLGHGQGRLTPSPTPASSPPPQSAAQR